MSEFPAPDPSTLLRAIPSVDKVVRELGPTRMPRAAVVAIARRELAILRQRAEQPHAHAPGIDSEAAGNCAKEAIDRVRSSVDLLQSSRIRRVINGTGVIVHTNLGRSPMGPDVVRAIAEIAGSYSNLEYDLPSGSRGSRAAYLEHNLAVLCGAQAATVVNNCAAALVLIVRHFSIEPRREIIISRGELLQIGGGFRIPEILESSGALLREIGTTNQTTIDDYLNALGPRTAMILKVHQSNFHMDGFVASPEARAIAEAARKHAVLFVEDLGSGATADLPSTASGASPQEPTAAQVMAHGADLVCFSGDKLMGGPQAGIIAGDRDNVLSLKKNPLFRALRCDKLVLTALQETVDLHLRDDDSSNADPGEHVLLPKLMKLTESELLPRAQAIIASLAQQDVKATIGKGESRVGGGTLPRWIIPSVTIDLTPTFGSLEALAARLRAGEPPVIGYISSNRLKLDLRTVFPSEDSLLVDAIASAMRSGDAPEGIE